MGRGIRLPGTMRDGTSLSEEAKFGGPRRKALLLGTLGYERKALGTGIYLHRGVRWATWSGLIYREL